MPGRPPRRAAAGGALAALWTNGIRGKGLYALLHPIWRRLPPRLRRGLYEAGTRALAPALPAPAMVPPRPVEPYLVIGPLSAPTGLGEASRLVLRGLLAGGRQVAGLDLSAALMQPSVVPLPPGLIPPSPGPGTVILTVQPPSIGHALTLAGRGLLRGKRRLGLWAWEVEALPRDWHRARRLVHEVRAPSLFAAALLSRGFGGSVGHLPFPLATDPPPPRPPRRGGAVVFGCALDLGSTAARKNPLGVVEAWSRAFPVPEAALLRLRLRDPQREPSGLAAMAAATAGHPTIELITEERGSPDLEAWYGGIDVLVSLHRAEGFGLLPAEAQLRGIPVIATDWSATTEFVSAETGWPVPAGMVPVEDASGRYGLPGARWAEPDLDAAAQALREAARDGEARRRKGAAAARLMADRFTAARFLAALEGAAPG